MLRSILTTAWRPIALAALLALAVAPANVWAAGHGGGYHGGGYHTGGYHGGGFHYGGYHAGGYRPGYYGGYHNGFEYGRQGYGYGYYGGYYSPLLYGSGAYMSGGYGVAPDNYSPDYSATAPDYSLSNYYTPSATTAAAVTAVIPAPDSTPGPATVDVHVPASAEVWFEDVLTTQTGDWRRFQSPPLAVGTDYHYVARARWTDNGRMVDQARRITVHAYEVTVVDFTQPVPTVSASK